MTHRNGFLLFISSCLSGCGQMYQGYMKRGLSLLLAFCLILFASTYFFLGALALFLPVIWLYAFSTAMRSGASWPPAPRRRTPSSSACPIWTANGWESCCASVTVSSAGRWW